MLSKVVAVTISQDVSVLNNSFHGEPPLGVVIAYILGFISFPRITGAKAENSDSGSLANAISSAIHTDMSVNPRNDSIFS